MFYIELMNPHEHVISKYEVHSNMHGYLIRAVSSTKIQDDSNDHGLMWSILYYRAKIC